MLLSHSICASIPREDRIILGRQFGDAAFQEGAGWNSALPLLPCRGGLHEKGSAFSGTLAVDASKDLGSDRSLLGVCGDAKQVESGDCRQ